MSNKKEKRSAVRKTVQRAVVKPSAIPKDPTPVESVSNTPSEPAHGIPRMAKTIRPKRREKICRVLAGNDIRYRGPLSYRHLRIIAWFLCAIAFGGAALGIGYKLFQKNFLPIVGDIATYMTHMQMYTLPLFMLANFAVILNAKNGYRRLIMTYGLFSALIYLGHIVLVAHYATGIAELILGDRALAGIMIDMILTTINPNGYLAYNIFIDLFLYTLMMFFLMYRPTKVFRGKWHIVFRLFAFIPILYEIACFVLKILSGVRVITLPYYVWPLLTAKPPVIFMVFLSIAFFVKFRERSFRKSGFTHQEFMAYQKTNRNSLGFSGYIALIFIVWSLVDFLMIIVVPAALNVILNGWQSQEQIESLVQIVYNTGVSHGLSLIPLAPFVLLFSYTKTYKSVIPDLMIPICGIAFVALFTVEFVFEMLRLLPTLS